MLNRTKHCWQNYVDYHKCILAKGEDFAPCRQVCEVSLLSSALALIYVSSSTLPTDPSALALGANAGTISEVRTEALSIYCLAANTKQRMAIFPSTSNRRHICAPESIFRNFLNCSSMVFILDSNLRLRGS
jgi:hypothetical protein